MSTQQTVGMCRGVHHLVLNTEDMKATIDFYMGVLDMPLIHALKTPPGVGTGPANRGNPPYEEIRHYFFDMGNDSLLAFFEIPKGAKSGADRDSIGAMQHVSFLVSNAEKYTELQRRLTEAKVPFRGPSRMASGPGYSMYFFDPVNGVRLEASCDTMADHASVVRDATQTREAVLEELRTLCPDKAWLDQMTRHLS